MDKEKEHIIADKTMLRVARVTSMVFTPFSIPFLSFLVLFLFSYLRIMPIQYKLIVLGIVYCFTILTPTITIFLFRKINGFARQELSERKKRYVPILLTIISYVFCLLMMRKLNIPWYMTGIILASLVVSVICIAVNLKWKLSEHMAGIGGVIGGLVSFSALFGYNPVAWLCLFILFLLRSPPVRHLSAVSSCLRCRCTLSGSCESHGQTFLRRLPLYIRQRKRI